MDRMPDITDDSRLCDQADELATDEGEKFYPDMSRQYMAAVETSQHIDVSSLCRVWDRWRDTGKLPNLLHGFLMISGLRTFDQAWHEIDVLQDMLLVEEGSQFEQDIQEAA